MTVQLIVGEAPGSGSVHSCGDVGRWIDEFLNFGEEFAAYPGAGERREWIMSAWRQLACLAPYLGTMDNAQNNVENYLKRRVDEVRGFKADLAREFEEILRKFTNTGADQVREAIGPLVVTEERKLISELVRQARAGTLMHNPAHQMPHRNPWMDQTPGPKVPRELRRV